MGNYCSNDYFQPILVSAKNEYEVWIMYYDGAICKHGCGVVIVFKSPNGHMKIFSFRFTWTYINNDLEYEALYLDLSKAISMGIICVIVHGDSKLVINQVKDNINVRHHYLKTYNRNRI